MADVTDPRAPNEKRRTRIVIGKNPVADSSDLARILAIPRRAEPNALALDTLVMLMTRRFARVRKVQSCDCKERFKPHGCITQLRPLQAWFLAECSQTNAGLGGALGPIGVGHGKEGISILAPMAVAGCQRAVLLLPSSLRDQFVNRDFPQWSAHFSVPNLAIRSARVFTAGLPVLHLVAYSELSQPDETKRSILESIQPDLIIANEAHSIADLDSSRTGRFLKYFERFPQTRFIALSGTMASKSIGDYAHLSALALRETSPLPIDKNTIEEWGNVLDALESRAPAGKLVSLCAPGESVREGFARRKRETLGVISSSGDSVGASLTINERIPPPIPPSVQSLLDQCRQRAERPDGEWLEEQLEVIACLRHLACGFWMRWKFPRGESEALINEWYAIRKAWNQWVREKLAKRKDAMDSPFLLFRACADGVLQSDAFADWARIKDQVQPEPDFQWIPDRGDWLARDSAAWATATRGIVWTLNPEFGSKVAELAGIPYFGEGTDASSFRGKTSIVCAIGVQSQGMNLQHFAKNLVAQSPAGGKLWEQMVGRTHRSGQTADTVEVEVYRHTQEVRDAIETARLDACFQEEDSRQSRKLHSVARFGW